MAVAMCRGVSKEIVRNGRNYKMLSCDEKFNFLCEFYCFVMEKFLCVVQFFYG